MLLVVAVAHSFFVLHFSMHGNVIRALWPTMILFHHECKADVICLIGAMQIKHCSNNVSFVVCDCTSSMGLLFLWSHPVTFLKWSQIFYLKLVMDANAHSL
jgi:hypothetical protein